MCMPHFRRFSTLALLVFLVATGCERPFIPVDPPRLEVVSPSLDEVLLSNRLPLALRATALRTIEQLTINGEPASFSTSRGLFLDTLDLAVGTNVLRIEATDVEGNIGLDTLFAVHLPYATSNILSGALPEPRADHTATALLDGSVLVTGGMDDPQQATATTVLVEEQGLDVTTTETDSLAEPRLGHTATRLPDGRVLVIGGASTRALADGARFLTTAELFDPATATFSTVPIEGAAVERAFHTALLLTDDDLVFIYLYGGRGPLGAGIGTLSSVTVLEVNTTESSMTLTNRSSSGGLGGFPAVAEHVQVPLPMKDEFLRSLTAGAYESPDGAVSDPVDFRFLFASSSIFAPFEIFEERVASMQEPRLNHAGAVLLPGLAVFSGGRRSDGATLGSLEVFADEAGRFFSFPSTIQLRTPRQRHSATLLPSGRILHIGGINASGTILASSELLLPATP